MNALAKSGLIFLGAGLGANARYWLGAWVQSRFSPDFPFGTFMVNVSGSFLIGLLAGWSAAGDWGDQWKAFLAVGLLGGYTTFSAFSLESVNLLSQRAWGLAATNILGSLAFCLAGCGLGLFLTRS